MELSHLNQINFNELRFEKIDCMIAACGAQPRCYDLAEKLHPDISRKILLTDSKTCNSMFYERFISLGFRNLSTQENEPFAIENMLKEVCQVNKTQLNLLIDYSCMPKRWYALIIDCITRNPYIAQRINLFFSYTPKIFERKEGKQVIDYVGPILLNRDVPKEKKPVSLIASLDNKNCTMMEAIHAVNPQKILAFVPHCTHDPGYTQLVMENNKTLLGRLDSNSIINYNADSPEEINSLLTSYCLDQRIASEVVIVPQGPKTFSMMSMLLSVRYPDVKLWEIILREHKSASGQGMPAGNPVLVKVSFVNDDEDDEDDQD
ncbi:MAG: hypothetical protein JXA72_04185 [Bacteroidales bacterium]|nr:hypothetical protein [Bacteroidales bacterium]